MNRTTYYRKSKKWLFITVLITLLLIISFGVSQVIMKGGILFPIIVDTSRAEYEKYAQQMEVDYSMPANISSIITDDYNIYYRNDIELSDAPVFINIHGGGLIIGSNKYTRYYCGKIAAYGALVFDLEYPLVPEADIYAQLSRIAETMDSLPEIIRQYHGNLDKVYLTGDSAGALLCVYTAALQQSPDMQDLFGVMPSKEISIKGMGLFSGMYNTTKMDTIGIVVSNHVYGNFYHFTGKMEYIDIQKLTEKITFPPIYIVSSAGDMLLSHTLDFVEALEASNQTFRANILEKEELPHSFVTYCPQARETDEVIAEMLLYLPEVSQTSEIIR